MGKIGGHRTWDHTAGRTEWRLRSCTVPTLAPVRSHDRRMFEATSGMRWVRAQSHLAWTQIIGAKTTKPRTWARV